MFDSVLFLDAARSSNASRLISDVKMASLGDGEIQAIIEILLNKQGASAPTIEWSKVCLAVLSVFSPQNICTSFHHLEIFYVYNVLFSSLHSFVPGFKFRNSKFFYRKAKRGILS